MNKSGFKAAFATSLASGLICAAVPANATVNICTGNNCVATDENVLVSKVSGVPIVTGHTQTSNIGVLFSSSTDALLNGEANGQADVSSADGLLNSLTFTLADGATFAAATFNLFPLPGNQNNEATKVILSYLDPVLHIWGTKTIDTNGQNFLGISGDAGERFSSVTFIGDPVLTGIADFRHLRLGGVELGDDDPQAAVPEPATWAMMLLGFGMMGAALRRKNRKPRVRFAF